VGLVSVASMSVFSFVANRPLDYIIKKVRFNAIQATGTLRAEKEWLHSCFNLGDSCQRHAPAVLTLGNKLGVYCTGGWEEPGRVGRIQSEGDSFPGSSNR